MADFITNDFLLNTKTAKLLYREYAQQMPIYDYHCHLPVQLIADDHCFENLTQVWLYGDHYKWRAMRANGIDERFCTGDASDYEKFEKWAQTVPYTLRNPLYHWAHLELKRYFGIGKLLGPETAKGIYDKCSQMLRTPQFSVRNLLRKMNVKLVCTTEGPLDSLEHHRKIKQDGFEIKVYTAFRPDIAMAVEDSSTFNKWRSGLQEATNISVDTFANYVEAIKKRHDYFHDNGCRLSDYGMETVYADDCSETEVEVIYAKAKIGEPLSDCEISKFKSKVLYELVLMDYQAGWVVQLHLGALRNVNTRMLKKLGPDKGYDTMGDCNFAKPLAKFMNRLESINKLPKMVLYNLNPKDNEVLAAMAGNFQDGTIAGKIQYGSAWWFLDQKEGIEKQINALSNMGLLSRFVGMLTDSRSFLSYPRHEYFRRVLCNILGSDIEAGLMPVDLELVGKMVQDICFNNARNYFPMDL